MLGVIQGFKAKLAEEATSFTEIPDDEVCQAGEVVEEMIVEDEGRQQ